MDERTENPASVWSSALILAILAAICAALVAFTFGMTEDRIAANERAYLEQRLKPVLEGIAYDGNLSDSTITIPPPHELPGNEAATIYRVFADDEPLAALFVVTARDGYSGPIKLLIGVDADGVITRVRVLEHRETPGLGDGIESTKSDWIEQFSKRSLSAPTEDRWAIKRDGGDFDQLTGASITPRAVVKAIKETLIYFEANRDNVFAIEEAAPADSSE